jgi:hypothetical protein
MISKEGFVYILSFISTLLESVALYSKAGIYLNLTDMTTNNFKSTDIFLFRAFEVILGIAPMFTRNKLQFN